MRIVWDEPKRLANIEKHEGFDFAHIEPEFFLNATILPARTGRLKAVGIFDGKPVTVIFKPLGAQAISLVSFRPAGKIERKAIP